MTKITLDGLHTADAQYRDFVDDFSYIKPHVSEVGVKDDGDKVQMELIPPELMFSVGSVLTFGAKKYGERNWEKGMSWSRVFGALMRHMWAWWGGSMGSSNNFAFGHCDDETKHSHLWHAGCCITFLIAYEDRKTGTDDRPTCK
jgi:hypothetical protein